MTNALAGIDHVIIGVRDLELAREGWRRLGFTLSPRGRHIGQGTGNYCIMFASDYIELLGIVDPSDIVQGLDAFLARREGLMATAFAPTAAPQVVREALLRLQLHPSEPRPLSRHIELRGNGHTPLQPDFAAAGRDPWARLLYLRAPDARADTAARLA